MTRASIGSERAKRWTRVMLWLFVLAGLFGVQLWNFLLFHSLAELFSVVIASAVFLVAWNSRDRLDQNMLVVVGVAYASVAVLDTMHTLAFAGMGVFPEYGPDLPTQLWIAARSVEAVSLVLATAFLGDNALSSRVSFTDRFRDRALLLAGYVAVTATLIAAIFTDTFPDAFVVGEGLTTFKIVGEYVIVGLLSVALVQLFRHRNTFDDRVYRYLTYGILVTILGELFFTLYIDVEGASVVFGHLLKIVSFYFVYLAVVKTGISDPQEVLFRELQTERNRLAARETELERKNRRLDEFANMVSHDLRNPLNVAMGRLELLRDEVESEHIDGIDHSLDRINRLIEDILTLAREGRSVDDVEPIDLEDVVRRYWRTVGTGEAELVVRTDLTIRADERRLSQFFENLFRNAIEHGGRDVTVTVGATGGGFYVEDDGAGIAPAEREHVFTAGYSTAADGTGFGLNIVREVADAHEWDVELTRGDGGGARFVVTGVTVEAE